MGITSTGATAGSAAVRSDHSRKRVSGPLARLRSDAEFFESLRRNLLGRPDLAGMYVAVHHRQVVGSDPDELALFKRLTAKYGDVPFFIGRVERKPRVKRVPSPRISGNSKLQTPNPKLRVWKPDSASYA
jgi:hypothetical protein